MSLTKIKQTSLFLSFLISFVSVVFIGFIFNKVFSLEINLLLKLIGTIFVCIIIISYILLSIRFEKLMINRVRELYNNLFPGTTSTSLINSAKDIDLLTRNLKKLNSDQNMEIKFLKIQENYRKEFIGNIAHELKTPLFTIQGYILTLLDGGIKDKEIVKKYLKRTSRGVDRLTHIIRDLDLITKFESGIAVLDIKPFNILDTIRNVFELLEIQSNKNKIKIRLNNKYQDPIFVNADEERIQQVITNLIINSLKYGIHRGITEVTIEPLEEEKILIRISDNGEGIEKKHLPRLFERFYRVEKTRNRKLGGSGLGLSIVKHIIDAHNEKIFVVSELNIGSEFSFTLALAKVGVLREV